MQKLLATARAGNGRYIFWTNLVDHIKFRQISYKNATFATDHEDLLLVAL